MTGWRDSSPFLPFLKRGSRRVGRNTSGPWLQWSLPPSLSYKVCPARGPWRYGASTQSKSTGRWSPSCHHPEDIRAFVFPVSHPLGGSYQVFNFSFFTFLLIFSYCRLCYETQWRLFSEWFWLSPCPYWHFYLGLLCFHPWVPKKSLLTVEVLL